jgi:CHAT domain-containing protein/Tfp pilus assembly protein PilF
MSGWWRDQRAGRFVERQHKTLVLAVSFLILAYGLACSERASPKASFEHARLTFQHGDLIHSQQEAEEGYRQFSHSNPEWASRFKILEAQSLLWRGKYPQVLLLLDPEPLSSLQAGNVISILTLRAIAHARQLDVVAATNELREAEQLCEPPGPDSCGEAFQGSGLIALGQNRFSDAQRYFERSLAFATSRNDHFLETTSFLNLGGTLVKEGRFDEAIDRSRAAYDRSTTLKAADIALVAQENLGWAYYRLGDSERALELTQEAEKQAEKLGDAYDQENALTNIGYIYMDARSFGLAEKSLRHALALAENENSKEHILNVLRVQARLALQTDDLENASDYADRAQRIAKASGNALDELYPILVLGQVAARRGDSSAAENKFREVDKHKACPIFLKWEAEHSLARLYEDESRPDSADEEYRAALATFEGARDKVRHGDFQLAFLTNASRIYDDYIHFLVTHKKTDDALRWADYSRARTLAEGLGYLPKDRASGPPPLNPREIARRAQGTVLFYWLGQKESYLWAITPQKTSLFVLPTGEEIETAAQRYFKVIREPGDVLQSADADGRWLYRTLISPAQALLKKDAKVFVIPDGGLNNLNFETLLVEASNQSDATSVAPKLHYWIEDATIANASSLRLLAATSKGNNRNNEKRQHNLLLVGNSIAPNDEYPALPKAAAQMESVARHFPPARLLQIAREQATPAAYLASNPGQFAYIDFVAHGTASRLSPLDSAIVLSRTSPSNAAQSASNSVDDSFKLYARDIIRYPLRADLVTISACYGAGRRAYSGEGLVGLSWAFLRAGAHNVVAALWDVQDASTEQLMDKFYDGLNKGAGPDVALRAAKLSLLRSQAFRNPYYWAPFQLYTGS